MLCVSTVRNIYGVGRSRFGLSSDSLATLNIEPNAVAVCYRVLRCFTFFYVVVAVAVAVAVCCCWLFVTAAADSKYNNLLDSK